MALFDINKYTEPTVDEIDLDATRKNFQVFIKAYKDICERIGQPRMPKVTQTFSLVPPSFSNEFHSSVEDYILRKEADQQEFLELHDLFIRGYSAVAHPIKSEVTHRRKRIFMLRYMEGLGVAEIMERMHISWDIVTDESKESLLQFSHALQLDVKKSELIPLLIPINQDL